MGSIGPDFLEDGEPVSSKEKKLPLSSPMIDVTRTEGLSRIDGGPPPTLVVPELISLLIEGGDVETCFMDPSFSKDVIGKLQRIYERIATVPSDGGCMLMGKTDVERWLTIINGKVGRGSEFRTAAKFMGWVEPVHQSDGSGSESNNAESANDKKAERPPIVIPDDGILTLDDFIGVYLDELRQGKFWGSKYMATSSFVIIIVPSLILLYSVAWDLAALGEPLSVTELFTARYDRMYCSTALAPVAVLEFDCKYPCPNKLEPSDHLPVAASFIRKRD